MDRRQFLAASSVGVATAMAGCAGSALSSDENQGTTTTDETEYEIAVSADGQVETDPDRATVSVGIEARGDTAEAVRDELATRSEPLREAFDDLGLPDENVEEGRYRVHPDRDREGTGDGFRGSRSFHLTIDDVDRVGEVVDAAIEAGADDVGRVNFTLQEETRDDLRNDALDDALDNADSEAEHVAANREVEITGTKSVTTSDVRIGSVRYAADDVAESADGAAPETSFDADPVTVSASVTVVYEFEP
ncbi:SIMPL domain-containing protein [Halosolutus amylolyticus]|uniref:SIMPL domain-containing protein n=1 Tax=Halosolutus amylolyticus TaxID=2932267 RepID=A0ABD5PUE3_9EURY|nr:SIMPL domain-containing protein [Halosolutus amylolyticus]